MNLVWQRFVLPKTPSSFHARTWTTALCLARALAGGFDSAGLKGAWAPSLSPSSQALSVLCQGQGARYHYSGAFRFPRASLRSALAVGTKPITKRRGWNWHWGKRSSQIRLTTCAYSPKKIIRKSPSPLPLPCPTPTPGLARGRESSPL